MLPEHETDDAFVDRLCNKLEEQLKKGGTVDLVKFLEDAPVGVRDALLEEMICIDYEFRRQRNHLADPAVYHQMFRNQAQVVQAAFHRIEQRSVTFAEVSAEADHGGPGALRILNADLLAGRNADAQFGLLDRLGEYNVLKRIGAGAFSLVYLAQGTDGRKVAIKVLKDRLPEDQQFHEMFRCEAETLRRIRHPAIVELLDEFIDDLGRPCLVMEYLSGGALSEQKNGQWDPRKAARFIAVLAEALHRMHLNGFAHRDVKPANILLNEVGLPKLADVGLALADHAIRKARRGSVAGTLAYLSPEQARGDSDLVDGRTDVYSLGIVLYEMLTGQRPFQADDPSEQLRRIQELDIKPPRMINGSIPSTLEKICLKATQKEPCRRYETAADFAKALRSFASAGQRRAVVAAMTLVGLAIMLLIGAGFTIPGKNQESSRLRPEQTTFTIQVSQGGQSSFQSLAELPRLLPGDHIRFSVNLDRAAYVKLLWIDGKGHVQEIYPRIPGQAYQGERMVQSLESPVELDYGWPLTPVGTTEMALLLINNEPFGDWPLPSIEPVESEIMMSLPMHFVIGRKTELLTVEPEPPEADRGNRTAAMREAKTRFRRLEHEPEKVNDPVAELLERLRSQSDVVHAVRIPVSTSVPCEIPDEARGMTANATD